MEKNLQEILIRAKKDVFGTNTGETLTKLKGDGLDFREIKEYEFGDDVKKINWKSTAKTGNTKVNVFNIERELNILLVFLASGSLHFGTVKLKQDLATEIITTLAYSSVKNNNRLSSLIYSNKEESFIAPSKELSTVYRVAESVYNTECLGKNINYRALCDYINNIQKERSLIFLVGDFYGDIDLSSIAYRHELYALIVRDRFEENPHINGEFSFVSPIDYSEVEATLNKSALKEYQALLGEHDRKLFEHFGKHQITSGKIYTDEDLYLRLQEILKG
jgi:uncharacterized protein (DUF58 family)